MKDKDLIKKAKARFDHASACTSDIRTEALDDLKFLTGDQWPEQVKTARDMEKRPCLTINRLPQFIRQVTNEQRRNRPAIQVNPVDDTGDVETAEILQGIIRHIENNSDASIAYDTAFEYEASIGFGYFRILTEYESPESFNQEIKIKRIKNPFTVYFDPDCREPDYSDAQYCIIVEDINKDTFKELYPKSEIVGLNWEGEGDEWINEDTVRIAEYWEVVQEEATLYLLKDGTITKEEPKDYVATRTTKIPKVKWYLISPTEILEQTDWPGKYIPIVPCLGNDYDVDGERMLSGMVRFAKDPQRMYNFWATAQTEVIALAPKSPWLIAEGQNEGYEQIWNRVNTDNIAVLPYRVKTVGGDMVPPPQRMNAEPPVQAITQARMQSADDLKSTLGIYDASLGAQSNEVSGKAILARKVQGEAANFNYMDNFARAIRFAGKIIIDLIPKIYDTPRVLRILGETGDSKVVKVNQPTIVNGIQKIYDLTAGQYDVVVTTGPSYATKRQEAVESIMSLTNSYPQLTQIAGDILVRSMDWPHAQEIADRIKKTLPPGLVDDDNNAPIPPQAMQKMQEMDQSLQALNAHAQQVEQALEQCQQQLQEMGAKETQDQIEIKALQAALKDKQAELALKAAELQQKGELESRKLDIQEAEILISAHDTKNKQEFHHLAHLQKKDREEHKANMAMHMHHATKETEAPEMEDDAEEVDKEEEND